MESFLANVDKKGRRLLNFLKCVDAQKHKKSWMLLSNFRQRSQLDGCSEDIIQMVLLLLAHFGEEENLFHCVEETCLAQEVQIEKLPATPCIIRYRFTSQSIIYIHNLIRPYICNITNRSHALTSQQIVCVALRFFANGSFLYNVGDAEHLSKVTVYSQIAT
ncbi:hypothetical protein N1851_000430 [Merluccius polli]|uniref:Uncharacterized protein n=1 Tax=Merluccius polli TaxID=89951 RepID=A0AA47NC15_MERPO|nr:hypothetical protein N1851_000430 [Merluccius polli]